MNTKNIVESLISSLITEKVVASDRAVMSDILGAEFRFTDEGDTVSIDTYATGTRLGFKSKDGGKITSQEISRDIKRTFHGIIRDRISDLERELTDVALHNYGLVLSKM